MTKVAVSGGFDPLHTGHVELLKKARELGDELVVILNNDKWLLKKKGFYIQTQDDRAKILENLEMVDSVIVTEHFIDRDPDDMSVSKEIELVNPDIFVNGGDRINIPEKNKCLELGTMVVIGAGEKINSSSALVAHNRVAKRDWGEWVVIDQAGSYKVKRLVVNPGKELSYQKHNHREEIWTVVKGVAEVHFSSNSTDLYPEDPPIFIRKNEPHKLRNPRQHEDLVVIEVQRGDYLGEDDIERVE